MVEIQTVGVEFIDAGCCYHYAGVVFLLYDVQGQDESLAERLCGDSPMSVLILYFTVACVSNRRNVFLFLY